MSVSFSALAFASGTFCHGAAALSRGINFASQQIVRLEAGRAINKMSNLTSSKKGAFTLVEIMIVVAIIALLAAIAVPGFLRARKRSQASRIINDLRLIDAAVDQYAIVYLKKGSVLYNTAADVFGNSYGVQTVDNLPDVPLSSWNNLSDVAGTTFFSPYTHL